MSFLIRLRKLNVFTDYLNFYSFYVFRRNPTSSQTLDIDDANSIRNSNFNPNHPTVVVVHGWLSNQNTNINPTIRDGKIPTSVSSYKFKMTIYQ